MPPRVSDEHLDFARALRARMTNAEVVLWRAVRNRGAGAKFQRQVPIGPYVADFACVEAHLVIELDGEPHEALERRDRDRERDAWLSAQGWRVVRFLNADVLGGAELVVDRIKSLVSCVPSSDPR